jgi:hypothetical protein
LIDPGAWSNLAGEGWVMTMAEKALKSGNVIGKGKLPKPMKVAGVGNGTNKAEWEVRMPIALTDFEGNVTLNEYHVPVVGEEGRELPALLGLQSMSRLSAVLEMNPGNEHLTLPGPGGYSINWSPGSIRYKLEQAPSGHLILPCDEFAKVSKVKGGLKEPMMTFFGNAPVKKETCESGTQTEIVEDSGKKQASNTKRSKNS